MLGVGSRRHVFIRPARGGAKSRPRGGVRSRRADGTTILPNDDVGDATNALAHLAYTQKFCDGCIEVSVGQLALKIMLDQNDYAGWDRVSFISGPLSGNLVRNFPIAALGIDTTVHLTDR